MGIYAQTHIEIKCEDQELTDDLAYELYVLNEEDKIKNRDLGFYIQDIKIEDNYVTGFIQSNRIQNLSYQCERLWSYIQLWKFNHRKNGIITLSCPFLMEADGEYFTDEE
jgi:hypothetical protein